MHSAGINIFPLLRAPVNFSSYALKNDLATPLTARVDPTLSRSAIGGKLPVGDGDGHGGGSSRKSVVTLAPGASAVVRATPGERHSKSPVA